MPAEAETAGPSNGKVKASKKVKEGDAVSPIQNKRKKAGASCRGLRDREPFVDPWRDQTTWTGRQSVDTRKRNGGARQPTGMRRVSG